MTSTRAEPTGDVLSPNSDTSPQLLYAMQSFPDVIRASGDAGNPNRVNLSVMVSPPLADISLSRIEITIPVGSDDPAYLSTADLPQPEYDHTIPWKITASGSKVTIRSTSGGGASVDAAISFTLSAIAVNEAIGTVPVNASEYAVSGTRRSGQVSQLSKYAPDTPVLAFQVNPPVVYALDVPVSFSWKCDPSTPGYVFRVAASDDSWSTGDCIGDPTECLACADGAAGVTGPDIESKDPPTFRLEAIRAGAGGRKVTHTIERAVKVRVPAFEPGSHSLALLSGRIQRLYWKANNASRCTVQVDNLPPVDTHAPIDTYRDGYLVYVPGAAGEHHITVTAIALQGSAVDTAPFPVRVLNAITNVATDGMNPCAAAFTPPPANTHALAGYLGFGSAAGPYGVRVVDPGTSAVAQALMQATSVISMAVANFRGNPLALTVGNHATYVEVIRLSSFPYAADFAHHIPLKGYGFGISLSADWRVGLVTLWPAALQTIQVDTLTAGPRIEIRTAESSALTPDGLCALATDYTTRALTVIPLASPAARTSIDLKSVVPPRPHPAAPPTSDPAVPPALGGISDFKYAMTIRVTSDGALAFIGIPIANHVAVVNLGTMTLEPATIPTGALPIDLALSPDGQFALVANYQDGTVGILDLPNRRLSTSVIACNGSPTAVAISADGARAIVLNDKGPVSVI